MRIAVFEYLTGGGLLSQSLSRSLIAEGSLMLRALVEDLLAIPDVEVVSFRDVRMAAGFPGSDPRLEEIEVRSASQFRAAWREQLARCDAVWAVAPETGGILEQLCREIESSRAISLNCPAEAVRIAASKAETARRLEAFGVPVIPTRRADGITVMERFPIVVKPDDGVGGVGSRVLRSRSEWENWLDRTDCCRGQVVQPLIRGEHLSLSILFDRGRARLWSVNRQEIQERDACFVLTGCTVNVLSERRTRYENLAQRIARAIPELRGYAGVDLIEAAEGAVAVEINPRITTSYAGLREALGLNPAQMILECCSHGVLPALAPARNVGVRVPLESSHDD